MKVTIDMNSLSTSLALKKDVKYTKFRVSKIFIDSNGMGIYNGCLLIKINNQCEHSMYDSTGITQSNYSFCMFAPPASIVGWDMLVDHWDFSTNSVQTLKTLNVEVFNNDVALLWGASTKIIIEIEFE